MNPLSREQITNELNKFRDALGVPAVFGGAVDADGDMKLSVVGNRRRGGSEPATINDQVHIGSCLKMITATLFGTFVTDQMANWEMPVSELFPDLAEDIDPGWHQRPVWELFCCVSGMVANPPRQILTSGHLDTRPLAAQRTDLTKLALSKPPQKPGRFVYSNMGYIVMGAAIDRLSGASYEAALEARLLQPLGVTSAGFGPPPDVWGHKSKITFGGFALWKGESMDPARSESDNPSVMSSAGTMYLRCDDWAKLLRLYLINNNLPMVDPPIIERVLQMPKIKTAKMCMGWAPAELEGISFGAQGSNTLWAATTLMDADRRRAAFVVCNDGRSSVLGQSVHLAAKLLAH